MHGFSQIDHGNICIAVYLRLAEFSSVLHKMAEKRTEIWGVLDICSHDISFYFKITSVLTHEQVLKFKAILKIGLDTFINSFKLI